MSSKRIGILTSGGDCPGLNAVIRGAVKAAHQLGYDCVGFLKGYEGLYDPVQYTHLSPATTRGILNQGGTILGSTNKGRFAATAGVQDRVELDPQIVVGVKQTIEQLGIDGLICVGGDGSLSIAQQLHENGVPVVGVPKTIDNDLSATAFTFGFDSAIECATDALDRLHTTAASHERIMVLEVMGRHAGWIALHSGIAGGGDVILIPEIEWSFEHVCHKILHRESQGKKFTLVVVAEGAELPGGGLVGEARDGQQIRLGGVGRTVADEIARRTHRETRLSVLGHLQRGGKPTTFDRVLATQFGAHAVRLVHEGRFGEMICSRPPEMTSVPILEAVNELRRVDPYGPAVQAARALGISFGDRPAEAIGQNIFDLLEPVSHVVQGETHETGETVIASEDGTPIGSEGGDPPAVAAIPLISAALKPETAEFFEPESAEVEATEIGASPLDIANEAATAGLEAESATEHKDASAPPPLPSDDHATEAVTETASDSASEVEASLAADDKPIEAVVSESPAEAPRVVEQASEEDAAAETPSEKAAPADQTDPPAGEADEPAAVPTWETSDTQQLPAAESATSAAAAPLVTENEEPSFPEADDVEVAGEPTIAAIADEDADEDAAVEEVVETVLDLAADADEAIHGPALEDPLDAPPAEVAADLAADLVEATDVTAQPPADEPSASESSANESATDVDETPTVALELAEPAAESAPPVDSSALEEQLEAAQEHLAAEIAGAAKASRDAAPNEPSIAVDSARREVADLVREKLAAVSIPPTATPTNADEEPTVPSHEEDLLAEARAALEEALAE